jgi:hypothetical protein
MKRTIGLVVGDVLVGYAPETPLPNANDVFLGACERDIRLMTYAPSAHAGATSARAAILDGRVVAQTVCGIARIRSAFVPVVAVASALAFRHATGSTITSGSTVATHATAASRASVTTNAPAAHASGTTVTSGTTRARRFAAPHDAERQQTHKPYEVPHDNLPGCGAVRP